MLTKVIICRIGNTLYTNAYTANDKLEYCLEDSLIPSLESIYLAKIISIHTQNKLAFINYVDDKIGIINLSTQQKLQAGSRIICQMRWAGNNEKYAKFSSQIKLIGKYVILTNDKKHSYSQALIWQKDIKEISNKFKSYGIIFRAAINDLKDLSIIEEELAFLILKQNSINMLSPSFETIQLVPGVSNYLQLLRDSILSDGCTIIVNNEAIFQIVNQYLDLWQIHEITLDPNATINERFKEPPTIVKINNGMLIFHKLSGINLIDINSHNSKLDFYQVNYLAIDEIVRQIKLYDLSGIILIDFIKNMSMKQQDNILSLLINKFANDWKHVRVLGFTKAGICEVIRNK